MPHPFAPFAKGAWQDVKPYRWHELFVSPRPRPFPASLPLCFPASEVQLVLVPSLNCPSVQYLFSYRCANVVREQHK